MDEGQLSMMEAQLGNLTAMQQNLSAETKTHTMLEQMMKMMADQKKETDGRFQSLESVVNQLQTRASSTGVNLGNLHAQVNNWLPSQPVANPRDNVSAITLRNGKELRSILKKDQNNDEEDETKLQRKQGNHVYNSLLLHAIQQILSRKQGFPSFEHKQVRTLITNLGLMCRRCHFHSV
ncbi:hypothetical protein GOBAR_DD14557 [Gossypium barbadense]|nr:hypothetical protein GOBAR_DD14557 [Gossypium barbadense]